MVGDYSQVQLKVRELTNNDPWGCTPQEMHQLCGDLDDAEARYEILQAINERWTSEDSTWRNIYKALVLFEYLLLHGSDNFAKIMSKDIDQNGRNLKKLTSYEYVDSQGKNQGINVRTRAEKIVTLLKDPEAFRLARVDAEENRKIMLSRKSGIPKDRGQLKANSTPSMEPLSSLTNDNPSPEKLVVYGNTRVANLEDKPLEKMPSVNLMGINDIAIEPSEEEFDDFQSAGPSPVENKEILDNDDFDEFQVAGGQQLSKNEPKSESELKSTKYNEFQVANAKQLDENGSEPGVGSVNGQDFRSLQNSNKFHDPHTHDPKESHDNDPNSLSGFLQTHSNLVDFNDNK